MGKNKENIAPLYVLLRPETKEFVTKAAEKAEKSASDFCREIVVKAAEKVMGKDAPKVEEFGHKGPTGLFSTAAAKLNITVDQLKSKLATEALGGTWTPPKGSGKKAKKG